MAQAAILRLPAYLRGDALRRISANANAPGAGKAQKSAAGWAVARSSRPALSRLNSALGIIAIESRPGTLSASVGGFNAAGVQITLATPGGTPTSVTIDANELKPVTYATPGVKSVLVTAPAGSYGETAVLV